MGGSGRQEGKKGADEFLRPAGVTVLEQASESRAGRRRLARREEEEVHAGKVVAFGFVAGARDSCRDGASTENGGQPSN